MLRKRQRIQKLIDLLLNNSLTSMQNDSGIMYRNFFGEHYLLPGKIHYKLFNIMFFGFDRHFFNKYLGERIEKWTVNPKTVIDCGAFVGGFTNAALKAFPDANIISIEPSKRNYNCLLQNISDTKRVATANVALGIADGKQKYYETSTFTDDSMSENSENANGNVYEVEVQTLNKVFKQNRVDVDHLLLKVEAEGYELAILSALNRDIPKWVVVDASPELGFQDMSSDIIKLLAKFYEVHRDGKIIFGVRK